MLAANSCCLLLAVKVEARKAEQETYSLMSEERLLREQEELEDSGTKSAPTPVSACLLIDGTPLSQRILMHMHAVVQAAHLRPARCSTLHT